MSDYRVVMEQSDKAEIIELYESGTPMKKIAASTGFTYIAVKNVIMNATSYYTEVHPKFMKKESAVYAPKTVRKSADELKQQVLDLYDKGKSINEIIAASKALTRTEIEQILFDSKKVKNGLENISKAVSAEQIKAFTAKVRKGQKYRIKNSDFGQFKDKYIDVTVVKLYQNMVQTDKGYFKYSDLYYGKKL